MGEVITHEGQAYLTHPWTGETQTVPVAEAQRALAQGLVPASAEAVDRARLEERYGGAGGQVLSALAGVGRGVSFGLTDLAAVKTGLAAPETLRALKDVNPTVSTMTEVGGAVAGMFIPGGPMAGLAKVSGRAGAGAARLAAGALKTTEQAALPRLARTLVRESTFGAGLSAGTGISEAALQDLSPEEATSTILREIVAGAGTGAALGALAFGAGAARRAVGRKLSSRFHEMSELRAARDTAKAEVDGLVASQAPQERIAVAQARLTDVTDRLHTAQNKAVARLFSRATAYGIGTAIGGATGGVLGLAVAPVAMRELEKALVPVVRKGRELAGRAARRIAETSFGERTLTRTRDIAERLELETTKSLRETGALQEAAGRAQGFVQQIVPPGEGHILDKLLGRPYIYRATSTAQREAARVGEMARRVGRGFEQLSDVAGITGRGLRRILEETKTTASGISTHLPSAEKVAQAVSAGAFEGLAQYGMGPTSTAIASAAKALKGAKMGAEGASPLKAILTGAILGGPKGAAAAYAGHRIGVSYRKIANVLSEKLAPGAGAAIRKLALMPGHDADSIAGEIPHLQTGMLEMSLLEDAPDWPLELVSRGAAPVMQAVEYLKETHPAAAAQAVAELQIPTPGARGMISPEKMLAYSRRLETTVHPETLVKAFAKGQLAREHVETWERVYPQALQELRGLVRSEVERVRANGGEYSTRQAAQIATLLGDRTARPKVYDAAFVRMLQELHQTQKQPGPRARPRPVKVMAEQVRTPWQKS